MSKYASIGVLARKVGVRLDHLGGLHGWVGYNGVDPGKLIERTHNCLEVEVHSGPLYFDFHGNKNVLMDLDWPCAQMVLEYYYSRIYERLDSH